MHEEEELIPAGEEDDAEELFEFYDNGAPQQGSQEEDALADEDEDASHSNASLPELNLANNEPAPALGRFMTPQLTRVSGNEQYAVSGFNAGAATVGPRRVKIVEPWKIEDIVVPIKQEEKPEGFLTSPQKQRLTEQEKRVSYAYVPL